MSIRDKKIVVCTPAGRQQYMRVLAPRLLSDPDIDRWDIWLNTDHQPDIDYIKELGLNPKIRVIEISEPIIHPVAYRIHRFFKTACDLDTIYIRLDDDIIYYHTGSIKKLAEYRLNNLHPFLVYGNVVNTAITSYEHQQLGRIPTSRGICGRTCMDSVGWGSSEFARKLHEDFLDNPDPDRWQLPDIILGPPDYLRQSINVISWLGEDCNRWSNDIQFDEEAWLSHQRPKFENRPNVIAGNCGPFVHYAFYSQRGSGLEDGILLDRYKNLTPVHINRLDRIIETIKTASISCLQEPHYLMRLLASSGLYNDGRPMYGEWEFAKAPLKRPGLWQHPEELANFMLWLRNEWCIKKVEDYPQLIKYKILEIGCFYGYLSVILHSYLSRFIDRIEYTAIDLYHYDNNTQSKEVEDSPQSSGLEFKWGNTSANYDGKNFDLVIIDADHNYSAAKADYERVKDCPLIMFHDIRDACVKREANGGGVPTLYQELKRTRHGIEFIRSDWEPWMGIGVLQ